MADGAGLEWIAVAPLFNLQVEPGDPLSVLPDIDIRTRSSVYQGEPAASSLVGFMLGQMENVPSFVQSTWVLVGTWTQPRTAESLRSDLVYEKFRRAVDALHLLHDEMVAFPFMAFGHGNPLRFTMGSSSFPFPSNAAWQKAMYRPYVLSRQEGDELRGLAARVAELVLAHPAGAAALALERLHETHMRTSDADRIIDSAIALEAILLRGVEDELSFRQAVRGAHLLGGTWAERQATFDLLKKAYSRRSRIVHGSKDPGVPSTEEIVRITRRVIRSYVEAGAESSHEELIRRLDADAVRGS